MNDGYVCFVQLIRVLCSFGSAERYERGAGALIVVRKAGCICFDPMYFYLILSYEWVSYRCSNLCSNWRRRVLCVRGWVIYQGCCGRAAWYNLLIRLGGNGKARIARIKVLLAGEHLSLASY